MSNHSITDYITKIIIILIAELEKDNFVAVFLSVYYFRKKANLQKEVGWNVFNADAF